MSCTGTKRGRSRGTAKSSLSLVSKNEKKVSVKKAEKISRFFTKISKGTPTSEEMDETGAGTSSDSPYKNCLSEVKSGKLSDTASDLDDFKTPTAIKKVSKISQVKPAKNKPRKRRKGASNAAPLRKFIEDNFKGGDVNADHLQMALALSESSYEAENPTETLTPSEKMESFKKALEKYGFGYSKNRSKVEIKQDLFEITKKNKKSRYRYITPILKMRTTEERDALISSKVSLILAQNSSNQIKSNVQEETTIFSDLLQQYHHQKILKLNHLGVEQLNSEKFFYVGLKLDVSSHLNHGHLLKDWGSIPGRETSPQRNITTEKYLRSISPDLFDSDDEYQVPAQKHREIFTCEGLNQLEEITEAVTCHELDKSEKDFTSNDQNQSLEMSSEQRDDELICHDLNQSGAQENSEGLNELEVTEMVTCHELDKSEKVFSSDDQYQSIEMSSEPSSTQRDHDTLICHNLNQSDPQENSEDVTCEGLNQLDEVTCHELDKSEKGFSSDDQYLSLEVSSEPSTLKDNDAPICHDLNQSEAQKNDDSIMCYDLTQSDDEGIGETSESAKFSGSQKKMENENTLRSEFPIFEDNNCNEHKLELSEFKEKTKSPKTSRFQLSPSSSEETDAKTDEKCNIEEDFDFEPISKAANCEDVIPEHISLSPKHISLSPEHISLFPEHISLSPDEYQPTQLFNQQLQSFTDLKVDCLSPEPLSEQGRCREALIVSPEHPNQSDEHFYESPKHEYQSPEHEKISYRLTKRTERVSSSEDDSKLSQESIYISDDEINYSSVCATPIARKNNENVPPNTNLAASEDSFNDIVDQIQVLEQIETPQNVNVVVKTQDVTPIANYDAMDTPRITKELYRFGLKPMKRHRGAKLLKYIYDSTHPLVEIDSSGDEREVKRRRTGSLHFEGIVGDIVENEWIFEKAQSKKVASCRVPLHIVWHNFVMCNSEIREKILLYEPLQLEVLHSMLKEQGFKFNIQDLLTFLDKKCITIRTAQGQRYGKKQRS